MSLQQGAQKVLRLSQRMLSCAEQGEWDQLGRIETERSSSLESLFRHPQIAQLLPAIAATLQEVIELDRQCMALGAQAREELVRLLNQDTQGPRGLQAYREMSG